MEAPEIIPTASSSSSPPDESSQDEKVETTEKVETDDKSEEPATESQEQKAEEITPEEPEKVEPEQKIKLVVPMRYLTFPTDYAARQAEAAIADALSVDALYEDLDFKGTVTSLYATGSPIRGALPTNCIEWVRVCENQIDKCLEPQVFLKHGSITYLRQGALTNSWFIGAVSVAATDPMLLTRLVVSHTNQSWGIFTVKFFFNDQWRYVHIDDKLPCTSIRADSTYHLIYSRTVNPEEMWLSLIEKAYAKLLGCYENFCHSQSMATVLRDLTGRPSYAYDLYEMPDMVIAEKQTWNFIEKRFKEGSQLGCLNALTSHAHLGILPSRVYGIIDVCYAEKRDGSVSWEPSRCFLKIKDYCGLCTYDGEWKATNDSAWNENPDLKKKLLPEHLYDGEYWISWTEFRFCFSQLLVSHSVADNWNQLSFDGQWIVGDKLSGFGGPPEAHSTTFIHNPHFVFPCPSDNVQVLVELSIADRRWESGRRRNSESTSPAIGWSIVRISSGEKRCGKILADRLAKSSEFTRGPSTSGCVNLSTGFYALVLYCEKVMVEELAFTLSIASSKVLEVESSKNLEDLQLVDDYVNASGRVVSETFSDAPEVVPDDGAEFKALQEYIVDLSSSIRQMKSDISVLEERVLDLEK